ncbi:hypothetical protein ES703_60933 [subsurface metagenome]
MPDNEWPEHYECVDVSAVDIAPEDSQGDDEPDVQYVSMGGKNKYKQKDGGEQV